MVKKIIPNLITFANLSLGVLSILMLAKQKYIASAVLIMIAALMDRYDGRIAKYLNATSELGKELDSLSDIVSFGVAPALLIYYKFFDFDLAIMKVIGICFLLLYTICGCYRLAKFNISKPDGFYSGIPITVAGFILALYSLVVPASNIFSFISMGVLAIFAFLMVSKFRIKKI